MTSSCFNTAAEWRYYKMHVNHTEARSVLRKFFNIYMQQRKRKGTPCFNYTNQYLEEQEELTASLYILIVIGFFGFLLFSLMISNIVSRKRENYADFLYNRDSRGHERKIVPQSQKAVMVAGKDILPEPSKTSKCEKTDSKTSKCEKTDSKTSKCEKTDSCTTAAETPSVESVLRNV